MKRLSIFAITTTLLLALCLTPAAAQVYDFGNETVTIGGLEDHLELEEYEEGPMAGHLADIEEKFNVNIEFNPIPHDDLLDVVMSGIVAGDPPADVILLMYHQMEPMAAEGMLFPLDDVLDEEYYQSLPPAHRNARELYGELAGETYAFSSNSAMYGLNGIIWNIDLFEREGLPNLYELQAAGEWTWEAMIDIAQELTRDTSGDGEIDQYGLGGIWDNIWALHPALSMYSNEAAPTRTVDGRIELAFQEEPALEAIELWHDLQHVYEVTPPAGGPWGVDHFIAGDLGMVFGDLYVMNRAQEEEMHDDYGLVFFPMGPNATEYVAPNEPFDMFTMPVTVENPEAKVELTNALYQLTDEYYPGNIEDWAEEEVLEEHYYPVLRDRESAETVQMMLDSWQPMRFFLSPQILGDTPLHEGINEALAGEQSPAAAIEAVQGEVQAHLDEVFGQ